MRRLYGSAGILIGAIVIGVALMVGGSRSFSSSVLAEARARWNSYDMSRYEMTVFVIALPQTPAALHLVIVDGEIVDETILACEHPSDDYPEQWCEPTRTYYAYLARLTIDDLFTTAEHCLETTREDVAVCPFANDNFQGFESREEMWDTIEACQEYLNHPASLCSVEFDDTYGYPREISFVTTEVTDGVGGFSIRDFELLD